EADAERDADERERLGAVLGLGDVRDVGLRERQVPGGETVDDAGDEDPEERRREGEEEKARERADLADGEERPSAHAIGDAAEDRAGDQRAERVARLDEARDAGPGPEA